MGVTIVSEAIEAYLHRTGPSQDPILLEMEERARRDHFPIVGPLVGRVLHQLTRISRATRILELGSGFGYSGYWFASALGDDGQITLTDASDSNLASAKDHFQRGGISCQLECRSGDALETMDALPGSFDIVFNDVDKHAYPLVFEKASRRLRPGGLLISDNVLIRGEVLEPSEEENVQGILEYTRLIFNSPDFFSSIIPIRDGISVSVKSG